MFFINFFHLGAIFCFFPTIFLCHPRLPIKIILDSDEQKDSPNLVLFLHPSSNRISSNCFSHTNPANGCPYKFRSKSTIFNDCPEIRSSVSWKTYPYVWTLWLRNCEQPGSVLRFYLSVGRCCISCLSVTIWQSCNNIHYFCGSHLDGRSAMFCKNCGGSRVVYYNVITEHRLCLWIFLILVQAPRSWGDICPSV